MTQPLYLAFVWHMHQPYYRDLATGRCSMPWVRLHATKDYLDMVERLKAHPTIHQTFNLVPALLDQLQEYLPPLSFSDEFLELSRVPAARLTPPQQRELLQGFFFANRPRMIDPFPRYRELLHKRGLQVREADWPRVLKRFTVQDYLDVQVWFNLVWIDPLLRRQDAQLQALETKGSRFTEDEKQYVLAQHLAFMARVLPAYKEAADRGQVELTTSPYYHPILPLLCDLQAARMALPHLPLPKAVFRHPEDARHQLQEGLTRHQAAFGTAATGVWPSEGSVSEEVARLAIEAGVRWIATDEEILWRTLKSARAPSLLYRPHLLRRPQGTLRIVFRDRELSDLIGFVYSQWDPQAAVRDFLERLGEIHEQFQHAAEPPLVSIILDGENAWEFYSDDGHAFLTQLYEALAADKRFRCVTVSEYLQQCPQDQAESLPELFSGSWIDGNFATWIGHAEKNAAWSVLAHAREALAAAPQAPPEAWKSLQIAEGSDWMWWFGDTHFSAQAEEFDRLFRGHVLRAYQAAGLQAPALLQHPLRRQAQPLLHEPTTVLRPTIDGRETSYYEWLYAGRLELRAGSAMHRVDQHIAGIYYGYDERTVYLRVDFVPHVLSRYPAWRLQLGFLPGVHVEIRKSAEGLAAAGPGDEALPCAFQRVLELAVPRQLLKLGAKEKLPLAVALLQPDGEVLERHPVEGQFHLATEPEDLDGRTWSV